MSGLINCDKAPEGWECTLPRGHMLDHRGEIGWPS